MDKRFWAIVGVIVIVFGGILAFQSSSNKNTSSSSSKPTSHIEGDTTSKVKLVEYGDYECPVCENYFLAVMQLQAKYNTTIAFQFRNLPLSQIHPNAIAGARAAEAADMQGKFWQMHDLLYTSENWQVWSTSSTPDPYFWAYAKQLGLNVTKFKTDFASAAANNRIQADLTAFGKTGEQEATPTFFLNGKYLSNADVGKFDSDGTIDVSQTVAAFSTYIDAALKTAGVTPPSS
jgi:protein-disulfide isomerase